MPASNFGQIALIVAAVAGALILAYQVIKKPEIFGLEKPVHKAAYLIPLAPLLFLAFFFYTHRNGGVTYPTGLALSGNAVIVRGEVETVRESTVDETRYSEYSHSFFIIDKETGKQVKAFGNLFPLYARNGLLLAEDALGYYAVDLKDGSVKRSFSENDIKEKIQQLGNEKVYELEIEDGGSVFRGRTVKDKKFTFDPLHNEMNVDAAPFFETQRASRPAYSATGTELFQPEIIATTKDRTTIVVSYDDLEQNSFLVTAIAADGRIAWTKRDSQISPELAGEPFSYTDMPINSVVDDKNLYFVTRDYLVCMDLKDGRMKWLAGI